MFERFTSISKRSVENGRNEAERLKHDYLGPEHLLMGILSIVDSTAYRIFIELKLDPVKIKDKLEERMTKGRKKNKTLVHFISSAKQVLKLSIDAMQKLESNYVGSGH